MIALLLALAAIAPTPADFAWKAPIAPTASGGLRWIVWTDSVYLLSLRPDHGDVALFTNDGKLLPWSGIDATGQRLAHLEMPLEQLPAARRKSRATKGADTISVPDRWLAEIPVSSRGLWTVGARLDLGTRNRKPFLGNVVLETSTDLDSWKTAGGGGICQVGSVANPILRDSVALNGPLERYLRVSIVSNTSLAVRSLQISMSRDSLFASAPMRRFREVDGQNATGAWEYDLGGDFPVDRLALAVGPQSILDARILARTSDDTVWTEITRSSFFQVEFQGHRLETPPVELAGSSFRHWRVVQVSGTLSQPPRLRVEWTPMRRIFLAGPGQEVDLAVGSRRLTSADPGFSENLFSEVVSQTRQNLFDASQIAPQGFQRIGTGQPDSTPDRKPWILALLVVAALTTLWFAWRVWKESTSGGTLGGMIQLLSFAALSFAAPGPLVIGPQHLYDMVGKSDAIGLVDEQSGGLDPKAGERGIPKSTFPISFNTADFPYEAVIDLQRVRGLTEVWYYDASGIATVGFATGAPGAWDTLPSISTSQYNTWRSFSVNRRSRYLRIVASGSQAQIGELVLYSDTAAVVPDPVGLAPVASAPRPTVREFMGVDGFIDDDPPRLAPFGAVREYHDWQWDEGNGSASYPGYPANQFGWNPSWTGWNFDAFYDTLAVRGIEANPALQLDAPWVIAPDLNLNHRPVPTGEDPNDPHSYRAHARWMYEYAARFGAHAVPTDSILLRSNNAKLTGLGRVRTMEDWNEPDKDWEGEPGRFRPWHLAAMISADIDGHHGTLGPAHGMRQADPAMKFAMPGITKFDTTYLRSLVFSLANLRGDVPLDVLNFHHYCNDGGDQGGTHTAGISPEADSLRQKLARVAAWRDRWMPGRKIWLSEFGWDSQQHSTQRAPTIAPDDSLETQARWIVRGFLEAFASGIDRAHLFYTRDYASWDATNFASSGLQFTSAQNPPGTWTRAVKPSWYYVATLSHRLGAWTWDGDEPGVPAGLRGARFRKSGTDSVAWAVWSPTSKGVVVSGAKLALGVPSALRVDFGRTDSLGAQSTVVAAAGIFTQTVSEKPFLLFSASTTSLQATGRARHRPGLEAFDIEGRPLGAFPDLQAARSALGPGIVLLRDGSGNSWTEFVRDR